MWVILLGKIKKRNKKINKSRVYYFRKREETHSYTINEEQLKKVFIKIGII